MPETRTSMTWAAPDSLENYVLVSSNQLFDGSWEKPSPLPGALSDSGDSNFRSSCRTALRYTMPTTEMNR
ncbi:hypothetical protein [Muribaculum gordoncarteri]|uniref:hypothetical protein n=1 Tax=Muribaculum gordoncarteri TaxID=2530390 RepID=UPI003F66CC69